MTDDLKEIDRIVQIASRFLRNKLMEPKNLVKSHWRGISAGELLHFMSREITELNLELVRPCAVPMTLEHVNAIMKEAADINAFAAMLVDNYHEVYSRSDVAREPPQTPEPHVGCDEGGPKGTTETPVERSLPSTTVLLPRQVLFDQGVFC